MRINWSIAAVLAFASPLHAQTRWELSRAASLSIGSVSGPPPEAVFDDIRGAVYSDQGMLVVADGGSRELRVFDGTGHFVRSFGGYGDGPGEFQDIAWLDQCGGAAVVVFDPIRSRITKWDLNGTLLDGFAVEGTGGRPPYSAACGPAGHYIVVGWPDVAGTTVPVGPYRPKVEVGLADEHGHITRILGRYPGPERYRYPTNDGPRRLGRPTIVRLGLTDAFIGTAETYTVEVIDDSLSHRIIGDGRPGSSLPPRDLAQYKSWVVDRQPSNVRPAARRALDAMKFPSTLPAYADFRLDPSGNVWIEAYSLPSTEATYSAWEVLNTAGTAIAEVEMPEGFTPTQIGADFVLGVQVGEMGVQRVCRYELSRAPETPEAAR